LILVDYQEIMANKLKNQSKVVGLKFSSGGHLIHLGEVSSGCRRCFDKCPGTGVQYGFNCMLDCKYCYYERDRKNYKDDLSKLLVKYFELYLRDWKPEIMSYQSSGETLLYLEELEQVAALINRVEDKYKSKIYKFLYTNGLLASEDNLIRVKERMRVNEIRFHLGATNFDSKVINNMRIAKSMGFIVTVETPSYLPHEELLYSNLELFQEIGIDHLNLVEVQVTHANKADLEEVFPGDSGLVYKDHFYHLYDNGLVYRIMEKHVKNKYTYSVIDCNSGVERCRHAEDNKVFFNIATLNGAFKEFENFNNQIRHGI